MPVPDDQSLFLPFLKALSNSPGASFAEIRDRIAEAEGLTTEDRQERLPSGREKIFSNRVRWAALYLKKAGLVEPVRRGVYHLTADGSRLLAKSPTLVDKNLLRELSSLYAEWEKSIRQQKTYDNDDGMLTGDDGDAPDIQRQTPEEVLDNTYQQLQRLLEGDLLEQVRKVSPRFFEGLVKNLLIAMGYGGGDHNMAEVSGGPHDGGIDVVIREDALGLEKIYLQAKRYGEGNTVGRDAVSSFGGALAGKGVTKGVFVTTSSFSRDAIDYAAKSPQSLILIDGKELARLMVEYNVGVRCKTLYEIKKIDEEYFDEDIL